MKFLAENRPQVGPTQEKSNIFEIVAMDVEDIVVQHSRFIGREEQYKHEAKKLAGKKTWIGRFGAGVWNKLVHNHEQSNKTKMIARRMRDEKALYVERDHGFVGGPLIVDKGKTRTEAAGLGEKFSTETQSLTRNLPGMYHEGEQVHDLELSRDTQRRIADAILGYIVATNSHLSILDESNLPHRITQLKGYSNEGYDRELKEAKKEAQKAIEEAKYRLENEFLSATGMEGFSMNQIGLDKRLILSNILNVAEKIRVYSKTTDNVWHDLSEKIQVRFAKVQSEFQNAKDKTVVAKVWRKLVEFPVTSMLGSHTVSNVLNTAAITFGMAQSKEVALLTFFSSALASALLSGATERKRTDDDIAQDEYENKTGQANTISPGPVREVLRKSEFRESQSAEGAVASLKVLAGAIESGQPTMQYGNEEHEHPTNDVVVSVLGRISALIAISVLARNQNTSAFSYSNPETKHHTKSELFTRYARLKEYLELHNPDLLRRVENESARIVSDQLNPELSSRLARIKNAMSTRATETATNSLKASAMFGTAFFLFSYYVIPLLKYIPLPNMELLGFKTVELDGSSSPESATGGITDVTELHSDFRAKLPTGMNMEPVPGSEGEYMVTIHGEPRGNVTLEFKANGHLTAESVQSLNDAGLVFSEKVREIVVNMAHPSAEAIKEFPEIFERIVVEDNFVNASAEVFDKNELLLNFGGPNNSGIITVDGAEYYVLTIHDMQAGGSYYVDANGVQHLFDPHNLQAGESNMRVLFSPDTAPFQKGEVLSGASVQFKGENIMVPVNSPAGHAYFAKETLPDGSVHAIPKYGKIAAVVDIAQPDGTTVTSSFAGAHGQGITGDIVIPKNTVIFEPVPIPVKLDTDGAIMLSTSPRRAPEPSRDFTRAPDKPFSVRNWFKRRKY